MAQKVRSCGIITLGAVIYALAFDWFVAPNQIAMGGVTGLAQIVNALVPVLPVGVLSILVNVPLFLAGWRLLGGRLLVSSLYAMAVSSLAIDVIAWMHTFPPMDPILATLYGGAGMGVGLGLVFSQGATTGGTDIIGKLLKLKFPWLPIGKLVMIPDYPLDPPRGRTFSCSRPRRQDRCMAPPSRLDRRFPQIPPGPAGRRCAAGPPG